jgi:hypothetical protein
MTPERRAYYALGKLHEAIGELMRLALDLEDERKATSDAIKRELKAMVDDLASRRLDDSR